MIKMMENYEIKVTAYQKKEENMIRMTKDSKDKIQEAYLERYLESAKKRTNKNLKNYTLYFSLRDRALMKEAQLEKQLEHQVEKGKEDVQNLKDQYEKILENIRTKNKNLVDANLDEIKNLNEQLLQTQLNSEKIQKENQGLKLENSRLQQFLKDDLSG